MTATTRGLLALALGLTAGAALAAWSPDLYSGLLPFARAVGRLWLDALRMAIMPLLFVLLVDGVGKGLGVEQRPPLRQALVAGGLLVLAALAGAALTVAMLRIWPAPARAGLAFAQALRGVGAPPAPPVGTAWFEGLIPANPFRAAADGAVGPWIVFSLAFGLAAARLPEGPRTTLATVADAAAQALMKIVGWVLWLAPLGVAMLGLILGGELGARALGPLAHYILTNGLLNLILIGLVYLAIVLTPGPGLATFIRAAAPAQMVALSTQSSLAALPAMLQAGVALDVSPRGRNLVLPLAVTLFRVGSAASIVAIALYIAHLAGVRPSPPAITGAILLSALISVGAIGLPSQVSYVATLSPVCLVVGAPLEALVLLMTVDVAADAVRTVANVTADIALASRLDGARQAGQQSDGFGAIGDGLALRASREDVGQ
jgi:proton glutamate symport protein